MPSVAEASQGGDGDQVGWERLTLRRDLIGQRVAHHVDFDANILRGRRIAADPPEIRNSHTKGAFGVRPGWIHIHGALTVVSEKPGVQSPRHPS